VKNASDHVRGLTAEDIVEVPTVFLLAEKMRLESFVRLRLVSLAMLALFYVGEGLIMMAVNTAEGLGFLCGSVVVSAIVVFTLWRGRSVTDAGGRIGRRHASYERALVLRGR
jgi:hypothetical protein